MNKDTMLHESRGKPMSMIEMFGREICAGKRQQLAEMLLERLAEGNSTALFCNVHMLMLSQENAALASAMDLADLVFADGVPVAWLQRRLGAEDAAVLRGYEAVDLVCSEAVSSAGSIGLFGSTEQVLDALKRSLVNSYPGLQINYSFAPGAITDDEDINSDWVRAINESNLSALLVGLGCPKQEIWVAKYARHLDCNLLAVGAAFDWLAGTTRKPPRWMEQAGLAWAFRFAQNPIRMFHRYMIYNSKFIYKSSKLLLSGEN